jgi:hypothetical protein
MPVALTIIQIIPKWEWRNNERYGGHGSDFPGVIFQ